ncbi:MAG: c-type cytochrome [Gammaproteobacteria bacterium]|nr:MAG: c-type cytochrome [Gammaproteobacteria bacterium]
MVMLWLSSESAIKVARAGSDTVPEGPTIGPDVEAVEISLAFRPKLDAKRVGYFGYGEPATQDMIAGWDIDVRPDGKGLPTGSGSVEQGEALYEEQCAACHGFFGEGEGRWPKLAGGKGTLTEDRPEKTVGSYWPYASTLWDYVHRAMPFYEPQSLSDDEVYAVSAYVLYLNDLVADDFVLTHENLASIQMPNRDGFFVDPRPDVKNAACMKNCKDPASIKITWDSTELGVTPVEHFKAEEARPAATTAQQVDPNLGLGIYQQACATCHKGGLAGAPIVGQSGAWTERLEQGMEVLIDHAINGYQGGAGYMAPKGGQIQLTDEEVTAAVDYMVKSSLEE